MLSNGNYAQYLPQGLAPQFFGAFGAGTPQFGPQGVFGQGVFSVPGGYGSHPGFGLDGQQSASQQIVLALGQLAQHVATQGVLAHQIGAWLGQLTQQLAQQIAQQDRQAPYANLYGGFAGNSPFIGVGNQAGFGNQTFGTAPGQGPFSPGASSGYGGYTPHVQTWGTGRPTMAS